MHLICASRKSCVGVGGVVIQKDGSLTAVRDSIPALLVTVAEVGTDAAFRRCGFVIRARDVRCMYWPHGKAWWIMCCDQDGEPKYGCTPHHGQSDGPCVSNTAFRLLDRLGW